MVDDANSTITKSTTTSLNTKYDDNPTIKKQKKTKLQQRQKE
jgi:hypothetical protein